MKKEMIFGIKTEGADKAAKDVKAVGDATKATTKDTQNLNDSYAQGGAALDRMTGGAVTAFKGVVSGAKKAVLGMKTLKGAVMATGIGALVLAVTGLVSYFTRTKRGSEALQVATAALGIVFDKIMDAVGSLGESLVATFSNPKQAVMDLFGTIKTFFIDKFNKVIESVGLLGSAFKKLFSGDFSGAFEDAKQGATGLVMELTPVGAAIGVVQAVATTGAAAVKSFAEEVQNAVEGAISLERRAIALRDAQRALNVQMAENRAEIAELQLAGENMNLPVEERVAALERAAEIEQALADERLRLAQEAVDIQREQNALAESTAEDLDALADKQVALAEAQRNSLNVQRRLTARVNSLYNEQEAAIKAAAAEEQKRVDAMIKNQGVIDAVLEDAQFREISKINDKYAKLQEDARANGQILVGIEEAKEKELQTVRDKYANIDLAAERKVQQSKFQMAGLALNALMQLNDAFAGMTKKQQKKAFQRNKKLSIASAVVNTAAAIADALAKDATFPGSRFIAAASAGVAGAAQVAKIAKTRFESADTGGGTGFTDTMNQVRPDFGAGATGGAGGGTPQLDLSFLGEGGGNTLQAFVIGEQVTTQQQADQLVTDQTTL